MQASADPQSPQGPARESPLQGGHFSAPRAPTPALPTAFRTPRHQAGAPSAGASGEADLETKRTGHLPSTAPPRGCRAALPPLCRCGHPALPTPPGWAASPRRVDPGRRSSASPPQAPEAAAAAAARARLRKPAGARRAAEVDRRHPALASPPPASSLSPPCPRWRRLRRRALRRLSRSCPGPPFPPRGADIGAPRPHPPARASSGCPAPPPSGAPVAAAAAAGAGLGPGGRLFHAGLRREVGRERARSPCDCADCGAPGGPSVSPRANRL